ncbi:MAG: DUF1579 family protein, partial [Akkermansiaceae bacterium]|nr:DUF1579 family protein [Akkermansiaceae bacterium]
AGEWTLALQTRREPLAGKATMRMAVKGRFLVCEFRAGEGRLEQTGIFIVGFDRRHGEWTLQAMDDSGTYAVFSRGKQEDGPDRIKLYGTDDDPHMKAMGYEKAFAHVLDIAEPDRFAIELYLIDTRSENRREHKTMTYEFTRKK